MLTKKRIPKSVLLIILLLSTGFAVGRASNGSNPIIDDVLGGRLTWFNATKGMTTPYLETLSINLNGITKTSWPSIENPFDQDLNTTEDVVFNSVNIDNLYLNDVNKNDLLNHPEQMFNIIIFKEESNYHVKNTTTGEILFSGIDADLIFSWVEGNLTVGNTVFVKSGIYNWDTMLTVDVAGTTWEGSGEGTIISASTAFFKANAENITIRNFRIEATIGVSTIDVVQLWKKHCTAEYLTIIGGRRAVTVQATPGGSGGHCRVQHILGISQNDKTIDADNSGGYNYFNDIESRSSANTGFELYKGEFYDQGNNIRVYDAANDAITICGAIFCTLTNLYAGGTGRTGMWLGAEAAGYPTYGNIIDNFIINMNGVMFEENQPFGVHIEGLAGETVYNNILSHLIINMTNGQHGISLTGSNVFENTITDSIFILIKNYHIEINSAKGNLIKGCTFYDTENVATYPIKIKNLATKNIIEDNIFITNRNFAIYIEHTTSVNNVINENVFYGSGIYNAGHNCSIINNNINSATKGIELDGDNCTLGLITARDCTSVLDINTIAEKTWIYLCDLRFNVDDVIDQGTNTIWTNNLDRLGTFHEDTAPDA